MTLLGCDFVLRGLGLRIPFPPGSICLVAGRHLHHSTTDYTGTRSSIVHAIGNAMKRRAWSMLGKNVPDMTQEEEDFDVPEQSCKPADLTPHSEMDSDEDDEDDDSIDSEGNSWYDYPPNERPMSRAAKEALKASSKEGLASQKQSPPAKAKSVKRKRQSPALNEEFLKKHGRRLTDEGDDFE